jgi:hypothetical protein
MDIVAGSCFGIAIFGIYLGPVPIKDDTSHSPKKLDLVQFDFRIFAMKCHDTIELHRAEQALGTGLLIRQVYVGTKRLSDNGRFRGLA